MEAIWKDFTFANQMFHHVCGIRKAVHWFGKFTDLHHSGLGHSNNVCVHRHIKLNNMIYDLFEIIMSIGGCIWKCLFHVWVYLALNISWSHTIHRHTHDAIYKYWHLVCFCMGLNPLTLNPNPSTAATSPPSVSTKVQTPNDDTPADGANSSGRLQSLNRRGKMLY